MKALSRKKIPENLPPSLNDNSKPFPLQIFERDISKTSCLRSKQFTDISTCLLYFKSPKKSIYRILLVVGSCGLGKSTVIKSVLDNQEYKDSVIIISGNITSKIKDINKIIKQNLLKKIQKPNPIILIQQFQQLLKANGTNQFQQFLSLFKQQFQTTNNKQILIATSNTINLKQLLLLKLSNGSFNISNDSGIKQIIFAPYQLEQLCTIIRSKIEILQELFRIKISIKDNVTRYMGQKCWEYKKGDVRVVIQIIKKLVLGPLRQIYSYGSKQQQIKEKQQINEKQQKQQVNPKKYTETVIQLTFDNVSKVLNQFFNPILTSMNTTTSISTNTNSSKLQQFPKNWQISLISIYLQLQSNGSIAVQYIKLIKQIKNVCKILQIEHQYENVIEGSLSQLMAYGIININKNKYNKNNNKINNKNNIKNKNNERIILKIGLNQIENAFRDHLLFGKFFEGKQ